MGAAGSVVWYWRNLKERVEKREFSEEDVLSAVSGRLALLPKLLRTSPLSANQRRLRGCPAFRSQPPACAEAGPPSRKANTSFFPPLFN